MRYPTNLHGVRRSARPTSRWAPKAHRMMGRTQWRHCEQSFGTNDFSMFLHFTSLSTLPPPTSHLLSFFFFWCWGPIWDPGVFTIIIIFFPHWWLSYNKLFYLSLCIGFFDVRPWVFRRSSLLWWCRRNFAQITSRPTAVIEVGSRGFAERVSRRPFGSCMFFVHQRQPTIACRVYQLASASAAAGTSAWSGASQKRTTTLGAGVTTWRASSATWRGVVCVRACVCMCVSECATYVCVYVVCVCVLGVCVLVCVYMYECVYVYVVFERPGK